VNRPQEVGPLEKTQPKEKKSTILERRLEVENPCLNGKGSPELEGKL